MLNRFIEINYKKWYNYAKIITNNNEADDLLHNLIIIFIEKDLTEEKLSDNYVFISLRNSFLTRLKKNKIDYNIEVDLLLDNVLELTKEEVELIKQKDEDTQNKLDIISKVVGNLNSFEKKLYQLHFVFGLSQRKIAREISVSHLTINQRINKIKSKIKIEHHKL
jgi:RNA polymerase sigma factor (sigma-70 family)